ncbi:MAG TPA: phospholipase D-like domain-containing protein [Burkholderiales bacterium]|jgi:cardiolipin synthase|nr:phospholipase D-like domain-containing protein [Burkholderiales bacterium]
MALLALALGGCATLPDVDPWVGYGGAPVSESKKIRGPLTEEQSKAVLAKLDRKGDESDTLTRQAALEEAVAGTPLVPGNEVTLLTDAPVSYQAMFEAIERATDHVHLEFYTIDNQGETGRRLAEALLRKRAEGVAVNLIYDGVGSIDTPREYFERLRQGGVNAIEFNPVNPLTAAVGWRLNHRDHRKLVIVDGKVAFTGGINISGVYSGSAAYSEPSSSSGEGWRDTNIRIAGPVVADLQREFLENLKKYCKDPLEERNWFPQIEATGKHPARVIASSPDDSVPAFYVTLVSAIRNATRSVYLTMAYFAPDPQTLEALKGAAARRVDVKLILPSYSDFWGVLYAGRSHYSDLLGAGIQIFERQERLLHAKTVVIDGVWATVGSSNVDWRSFLHNEELNVVVLGRDFGSQMEASFRRDLDKSKRITPEEWEQRSLASRIKEAAGRVWEYWL